MQRTPAKSNCPATAQHPAPPPARRTSDDTRWAAVVARDAASDGHFYTAVATTGIYCRPSCAARRPRRENVTFYPTADAAEAAGYRPCKRCKPRDASLAQQHRRLVAGACRMIETAEEEPALGALAAAASLSPHHFHRVFKSITGLTPKAYAMAHRRQRVQTELAGSNTVTNAFHAGGFNSSGRFYANARDMLGMTPSAFRTGGAEATIRYATARCSLGWVLVAATEQGVCAIFFGDAPEPLEEELQRRFAKARLVGGDRAFAQLTAQVIAFVEAPGHGLELPLDIQGTAFQQRVWQALRDIPAGTTATYADIAARIGSPKAVRAVGTACGANPIAVAIPCHRVVRKDGAFPDANYRWGVARKRALLAKEAKE